MLKKNLNISSINLIGSMILLFVGFVYAKVLSPVFASAYQNAPGKDASLLLPTTSQGTGYYISHPISFRR